MAAAQASQSLRNTTDTANSPIPELDDAAYFLTVLQLPEDHTESQVENDLVAKANSLGISTTTIDKRNTTSVESASSVATYHARTLSMLSNGSVSTALTTHSSLFGPPAPDPAPLHKNAKRDSRDLSFSQYDRYLKVIDPQLDQPKAPQQLPPSKKADPTTQSIFSIKSRRSFFSVKSGFRNRLRWRRKLPQSLETMMSCVGCKNNFKSSAALHNLSCGHTHCSDCLRAMVNQSVNDESQMPPRCCLRPIPSFVIKEITDSEGQQQFLKAVIQYGTPWEARIFCPNTSCGEFIPPHHKVDPKHPFNVTCRKCGTRVCVICKRNAHPTGKDCPEDWELDEITRMTQKSGWKRCYRCRNLVELTQGCPHMACRCKAELCSICGSVWDHNIGCLNSCNVEEEMDRRRKEEQAELAKYEAEKAAKEAEAMATAAERSEAEKRSKNHSRFQALEKIQEDEMERFREFVPVVTSHMRSRHVEETQALVQAHKEQEASMHDKHVRAASKLEDRQVAAEMELRATLEQSERSVKIRLKHMEAYCERLGRGSSAGGRMPARTVTERDLRELGQQYNLRDGMERLHAAKINVMRDQQAQRMEELLERQETEIENLLEKQRHETQDQVARFSNEENALASAFAERKTRLIKRWEMTIEILQKELESKDGLKYAPIPTPSWPESQPTNEIPTRSKEERYDRSNAHG